MADEKVLGILYRARGAAQVSASSKQVESSITSLHGRAVAFASTLKTGVGNALTTFGGRLKQAATGIAAFAGIGGILGLGGAIEQGITKAQTWGLQIEKLQGITHDGAEQLSGLLAVTEKYGLSNERLAQIAGFTEKSLGALALKAKATTKFQKEYGFAVTDAHGRVKDFSTLLLSFADYWKNGAETPAIKAAAAAKLFGRGYADLVPILNLGAKGIADAEAEAKALGLTLTQDNVTALAKAREATRQWGDAIGGLELQIGLALLPALTDLAHAATAFVSGHRGDIVTFFTNAVAAGRHVVTVVESLAAKVNAFWSSIPQGVRDLLVKGIIADRTVKFLFGISPIHIVASLATSAISGVLGGVGKAVGASLAGAGLGKLFVQPVFVTNMGPGGLGGGAGAAEGAAAGEAAAGAEVGGMSFAEGLAAVVTGAPLLLLTAAAAGMVGVILATKDNSLKTGPTGSDKLGPNWYQPNPTSRLGGRQGPGFKPQQTIIDIKGPIGVVDNSPGARDERTAARQSALSNAKTAAHTESLNAGFNAKQQKTISAIESANAKLRQIADKREENRINVTLRTSASTFVKIGVGGITKAQTTVRVYGTGGATGKYLS